MKQLQGWLLPGRILTITIVGIALAEVAAMLVVYNFREWTYSRQVLLDTVTMTTIVFPLLYFLSFKPLLRTIEQRNKSERIIQARIRMIQFAIGHTVDELLQYTIDETERMTLSTVGFFHFLEADQKTLGLQAWSTNTLQRTCEAEGQGSHSSVDEAGVWADAVREGRPVIHNQYASLSNRKGMPAGHTAIVRELVIPILRDQKVVAVVGVGNKPQDYTDHDVEAVSTLADFAWEVIKYRQAEAALSQSEEKFRTLVEWTYDWEEWLDPDGTIIYSSPSCKRITGYSPEEFTADPNLLIEVIHPEDRQRYIEHQQFVHESNSGPLTIEYRVISRDGDERWIEHICRPLSGTNGKNLGRRVSNRDVTERKRAEQRIYEELQKGQILTQAVETIQMDIARDLHDTLGQNIGFLRMNLDHLSETEWKDPAAIKYQIQNMTKVANESFELIRAMLAVLQFKNPNEPLDLFTKYAQQVAERSSLKIQVASRAKLTRLSPGQVQQLFYIFREALSNTEKYAEAAHVFADFIVKDHSLRFEVCDDGRGFNLPAVPTPGHFGINFMRERAALLQGSFSIQSAPGQGTTIAVVLPYETSEN